MSFLIPGHPNITAFARNWGWFLLWGIALIVLGALAICYTTFSTLLSVIMLGVVISVGGVFIIIDTFSFWWRKWSGFFLHLLMGILYLVVGYMLIYGPVAASVSITLILAIFYIVLGVFRIVTSLSLRTPRWGWNLFNGIIALLLGLLIFEQWPMSGLYIIGLFVGIDLLFTGWAYVMAGLGARALMKS
jgi:uncharacterized membrane protein HdeD (DUF308 family)